MKVVIVHGSNESEADAYEGGRENTRHFHPWLKEQLEKKSIEISCELYPKDWNPSYTAYREIFEKNNIDEETVLVGHSAGCGFILKWLNETRTKVKKVILVAPYVTGNDNYEPLKELYITNFKNNMKEYFDELIIFYSEDDMGAVVHDAKFVHKKLGGNLIRFENRGHFTLSHLGTEEFPELLREILK